MKHPRFFGALVAIACVATTTAWAADAVVGKPAPDFTATDIDGKTQVLSQLHGHIVVLEWFNPECPFVKRHYGGNMQQLQGKYTGDGVTWVSIDSSAAGKQGFMTPEQAQEFRKSRGAKSTAILLDSDGNIGKLYGAKSTPHMFIVNPEGTLVCAGAIDDHPSADMNDPAPSVNYVSHALDELLQNKPVSIAETPSYGCSVKY